MAMTPQELRDAADQLRRQGEWLRTSSVEIEVEIENDDYYVDLGAFGEHSMGVTVRDDYYEIDPEEIFDRGPAMESDDLTTIAQKLDETAEALEEARNSTSLTDVLGRMVREGTDKEKMLAIVLGAVCDAVVGANIAPGNGHLSVGALPPSPLPWPGALNPEIDYTDPEFALRYQPPPGFVWADGDTRSISYRDAVRKPAGSLEGLMHMDDNGRVVWIQKAPDSDYTSGERFLVWHSEREENGHTIPAARGYNDSTPPRALTELGRIIEEPHTSGTEHGLHNYNWSNLPDPDAGFEVLRKIREAATAAPAGNGGFQPPAPVSL